MLKWVGETGTQSHYKPHSWRSNPQWGENAKPNILQKGVFIHVRSPSFCHSWPGDTSWLPGSGIVEVPGSHGTITIRQFLASNHSQGIELRADGNTSSFCERGLFALSRSFGLREGPMKVLSGNGGWWVKSLYSSSASFQLTLISQKGAYTLVWSPHFCDGQATSRLLGYDGQQGLYLWHTRLYIFAYSKICCLRIWLIISPNLDIIPLGHWYIIAYP